MVEGRVREPAGPGGRRGLLDDSAWLRARYVHDGLTLREVAALVGGGAPWLVSRALARHGIERRPRGKRPGRAPLPAPLSDREWLTDRYERQAMSVQRIADQAGASASVVARALREHGLDTRRRRGREAEPGS